MADVPLNGINFQIKGETKNAVTSINQLQKALSKLEKIHIKDFGLKSASKEIKEFAKAIDKIDATKLTAFSKGLSSISGVGRTFEKISKNPEEFAKSMELLTGYLESISKIDFSNLQTAADGLRAIAKSVNKITGSGESGSIEKTTSALSRLKDGIKNLANSRIGKAFKNGMVYPIKQMIKPIKGVVSGVKAMTAGIGRIAMYRLFRSIIKAITQALQEGTKNLYQYSKAMSGSFAANMDSAATSMLYFKNSIAAAWSPLMNLLAPALDAIVDKVVAVINVINQLIAILSGQTGWTRAVKQATEYEEAVGGAGAAAKDAMRYLAPFDELNVLPDDKSGGGGGGAADNYSTMFEEMSTFSDFVQSIKDMIDAGDWQGVGTLIGTKINDVINNINFGEIGTKVGEKINALFTTEYWTLKTINFQNIGAKIAEFLNNALAEIDFSNLGGIIAEGLTILPDLFIGGINNLDFGLVGQTIGDTIKGFFNNLSDWIAEVNWRETFENLFTGVGDFIRGLDLAGIMDSLLELGKNILLAILDGIVVGLENIGEWVKEHIIDPIKQALGIGGNNQTTTGIGVGVGVSLTQNGWTTVADWVMNNTNFGGKVQKGLQLIRDGWKTVSNWIYSKFWGVDTIKPVGLKRNGWSSVSSWIWGNGKADGNWGKDTIKPVGLTNKGLWSTVSSWIWDGGKENGRWGKATQKGVGLLKSGWSTVSSWIYDNGSKTNWGSANTKGIGLEKSGWSSVSSWVSGQMGSTYVAQDVNANLVNPRWSGGVTPTMKINAEINNPGNVMGGYGYAKGGAYFGGRWHDIPQAAGGGRFHGSLFWAGENGAEIVGHAGGRTEVLNRSQMASVMYSAVVAGISRVLGGVSVSAPTAYAQDGSSAADENMIYRAFKRALDETDFGSDVTIDGDMLYRSMVNKNRQNTRLTGVNAMAV